VPDAGGRNEARGAPDQAPGIPGEAPETPGEALGRPGEAPGAPGEPPLAAGNEIRDPLRAALACVDRGEAVGLATVVRTWGSAPRQPGAQMCVDASGDLVGSVSGGCVEGAVIQTIQELLASGGHELLSFGVSDDEAWEVGLACGGRVDVLAEVVRDDTWLRAVIRSRDAGQAVVAAVDQDSGDRTVLQPFGQAAPGVSGPLLSAAREAALIDRSQPWEGDGRHYFLHVLNPPVRVLIVGAVHIAQPLAAMARHAGFGVVVIDPREAFATVARFPGTTLAHAWPHEALAEAGIDHRCAVVTVTHDPKLDDPALRAALESPAFYVGALGSRRTHAKRTERLVEAGLARERIQRIHAPVGLDIGARTPGEIAASVLAEIIATLRNRPE